MNLWAVTMVRDELDILPYTIAHLESEGIDGLIVADNGSTDGTREWLDELHLDCELIVVDDPEIGYYQSRKMTALAHTAFSCGADWVIPFDADELWFNAAAAETLHATLEAVGETGALLALLTNYYPFSGDDPNEPNPFWRITHRDRHPAPLPKVIVSHYSDLVIAQGNHDATATGQLVKAPTSIQVAHFPWRSPDQFVRKVRNGAQAYEATDLDPAIGAHWRQYGQILNASGPEAVEQIFHEWFCDPDKPVEHTPAPWCRFLQK